MKIALIIGKRFPLFILGSMFCAPHISAQEDHDAMLLKQDISVLEAHSGGAPKASLADTAPASKQQDAGAKQTASPQQNADFFKDFKLCQTCKKGEYPLKTDAEELREADAELDALHQVEIMIQARKDELVKKATGAAATAPAPADSTPAAKQPLAETPAGSSAADWAALEEHFDKTVGTPSTSSADDHSKLDIDLD